jgi:cyclase
VDELLVLDIVASKEGVEPDYRMIGHFAGECFMPRCYGGGIRTLDQAKRVFDLGVEKVCLQSAVLDRPAIVTEIAGKFGSQSVVASVDVKRDWLRRPRLYRSSTGKILDRDWLGFLRSVVEAGAGEVVLNAVDRDGEMGGYDMDSSGVPRPRSPFPDRSGRRRDVGSFPTGGGGWALAVACRSDVRFLRPAPAVLISYPPYSELENLFK